MIKSALIVLCHPVAILFLSLICIVPLVMEENNKL